MCNSKKLYETKCTVMITTFDSSSHSLWTDQMDHTDKFLSQTYLGLGRS